MSVQLNHTIVWCNDQRTSADFLAAILGRPEPTPFSRFLVVELDNGVSLDFFDDGDEPVVKQHYAFLVGEPEFDAIFGRIQARGLDYWADPGRTQPGQTYRHNGGRGVYFPDPDDHLLEVMTRPYATA
jgi:catechol 2,3-dioxygenase-like lactoylglutathione lyase family enzyme